MYIIHSEKKYRIEELAKHSMYFDTLKSNNFSENQNRSLDLSHRGQPMKDVLDMIVGDSCLNLSSERLKKMRSILDEFLFSKIWQWKFDENNHKCIIYSALEKEREEEILKNAQEKEEKEGTICSWCGKINKWLIPQGNLDWDEQRSYCYCDYTRDEMGYRIDDRDWLWHHYNSNDRDC